MTPQHRRLVVSTIAFLALTLVPISPGDAMAQGDGIVLDGETLRVDVQGEPGDWVIAYLPFEEPTDRVDYTTGAASYLFQADWDGGVYLPFRVICASDPPFSADGEFLFGLFPRLLAPGEEESKNSTYGSGSCSGPNFQGVLFVLGGTVAWRYDTTVVFADFTFDLPIVDGGSDMQSWSREIVTLGGPEPTVTQDTFNVSTGLKGWLHAEIDHDPVEGVGFAAHASAGEWTGQFPSGRIKTRQFINAGVTSVNGWNAMGGFHEPGGEATLGVDMASADPGAHMFFAHIPGLLDKMPFNAMDY